jgi:hypothetical protein
VPIATGFARFLGATDFDGISAGLVPVFHVVAE